MKKIIFLSSTSIYQNVSDIVDEKSAIVETSLMAQAESLIQASKIPSVTLRLGGLMGGDRFVAKYFSGRRNDGANCPVNYVHKDDVVALCALTVEKINSIAKNLRIEADCVKGGSIAKDTFLKKDHDVDLFVRFSAKYKDEEFAELLEKIITKTFPKKTALDK